MRVIVYTNFVAPKTILTDPKTILVFAQASAGLGHLRVTDALYHGLPAGATGLLLNSQDKSVTFLHNITSRHPALRAMMEFTQHGWAEELFTRYYRKFLRNNTQVLENQLRTILDQHITYPKTLLVVATHFGLAHQFAAIKEAIAHKYRITVYLVVIVTDDSPQKPWAVGGADLIFVPSERTKFALERYHKTQPMKPARYVVLPYMVSPRLGKRITRHQLYARRAQLDPRKTTPVHLSIPISGAAVQLTYVEHFLSELRKKSNRFVFHIVSRQSPVTQPFLATLMGKNDIDLQVSTSEREVIELYEKVYLSEVIGLEVTKPSEQAFKTLFTPRQRGGSILLFSNPVGRQEHDNIDFLVRHDLLPSDREQKTLWEAARKGMVIDRDSLNRASAWRALRLPFRSAASAQFLWWAHHEGLLAAMGTFVRFKSDPELSGDGVSMFWQRVATELSAQGGAKQA